MAAGWTFTASAVVVQPVLGLVLANAVGWPPIEGQIVTDPRLHIIVSMFWMPVRPVHRRVRDMARSAT